ncbi:helix-turn-helix domain-containing protein [Streptomyces sp. NPDC058247]|uniref:helix-turn-helix domain-containing protein n=1 Tax=Streptomyces sp. NPDC058247 TaxID=3346401 RepID=UPI0036E4A5DD
MSDAAQELRGVLRLYRERTTRELAGLPPLNPGRPGVRPKGLSMAAIDNALGWTPGTYQRLEAGRQHRIRPDRIDGLARLFQLSREEHRQLRELALREQPARPDTRTSVAAPAAAGRQRPPYAGSARTVACRSRTGRRVSRPAEVAPRTRYDRVGRSVNSPSADGMSARVPQQTGGGPVGFPTFTDALAEHEAEALRTLYVTCQGLQHEYESALAVSGRASRVQDTVDVYGRGQALPHHSDALNEMHRLAERYERGLGLLAWRYASAAAVLGVRILERVAQGRPALSASEVAALCEEPTLNELRQALSLPGAALLPARDAAYQEWHDRSREELLQSVAATIGYATEIGPGVPTEPDEAAAGRLTDYEGSRHHGQVRGRPDDRPGHQPLYEGVLERLLARTALYPDEIDWSLKTPATALSR